MAYHTGIHALQLHVGYVCTLGIHVVVTVKESVDWTIGKCLCFGLTKSSQNWLVFAAERCSSVCRCHRGQL